MDRLPVDCRRGSSLLALVALLIVGCGPKSDRLEVGGAVALDGTPLDSGSIRFSSVEGQKLVSTGALVKEGEYLVPQEKGLPPGKYRVEITSPDMNAPPVMVSESPGSRGYPTAPERIPPEYNVDSRQSIEVTSAGNNRFDFEIVSKSP
jgi:hypothetical protein